jgi:hypothetical protein
MEKKDDGISLQQMIIIKNIHAIFLKKKKPSTIVLNEYLLTRLRTKKGADLNELQQN